VRAIEDSRSRLRALDRSIRDVNHQVLRSRALICEARRLVDVSAAGVCRDEETHQVWQLQGASGLQGDGRRGFDCLVERVGSARFRLVITRNEITLIEELFSNAEAAIARARQIGDDLVRLGWIAARGSARR
jgi:hypothetical protein